MKKTYMTPALSEQIVENEMLMAASVTKIGGNSDITWGEGEAPTEADVKEGSYFGESIFD